VKAEAVIGQIHVWENARNDSVMVRQVADILNKEFEYESRQRKRVKHTEAGAQGAVPVEENADDDADDDADADDDGVNSEILSGDGDTSESNLSFVVDDNDDIVYDTDYSQTSSKTAQSSSSGSASSSDDVDDASESTSSSDEDGDVHEKSNASTPAAPSTELAPDLTDTCSGVCGYRTGSVCEE
jgi:hypothetical protein